MGIKNKKNKEDWRYKAIVFVNIIELILALGIIYFAVTYSYWLLFLLLAVGVSNTERRILGLPEEE